MLAVPVVLCLLSGTSSAVQGPVFHWLRVEGGGARLDSRGLSGLDSPWGGVRVGGALDRGGVLALDLGLQGGTGPEPFSSFTLGAEIRLAPRSRLSGFVRAEIGALDRVLNSEYLLVGAGGGFAVRVRRELAFRAGVTWNSHGVWEDGHFGPVQAYGGLELGW